MKRALSKLVSPAFALLVLLVAACSGHGSSIVPHASASSASGSHTAKPEYGVRVKLLIPSKPASASHRRKRQYVSYLTASAEVIVNNGSPVPFAVSSSAPNCIFNEGGGACTATIDAPAGPDTFTMNTYDGPLDSDTGLPTGNLLSSGTAVQTITNATANQVDLTLDGVVASLVVSAYPSGSAVGTATSIPIYVNGVDPDGNDIVGPGSYIDANGNPVSIAVTDTDASNTTSISGGPVTMPYASAMPLLVYTGAQLHGTIPVITASATGFSPAATPYPFTPVLTPVFAPLAASPSAMTAGSDGAIYLLEPQPVSSSSNVDVTVEQHVPAATTDEEFTYTGCLGNGVLSLNPGIVSVGSNLDFATYDVCGQTETGELVSMTQTGATSSNIIDDEALSDVVLGSSALGYPGTGSNVQLVATVTPGPNASSSPPPIGPSFVTSSTAGSATSYAFRTALGLSATDTYSFANVAGHNIITYDASGSAWFPETITDNTTATTTNVMVHATSATAGSFPIPQPAGGTETITAVTTGSDGNIWYVGNRQTSAGQTIVVGNVTAGGAFTEYPFATNSPAGAVSSAIVEGSDGALYTLVNGSIARVTHGGVASTFGGTTTADGSVTTGLKLSNGDLYFTGSEADQGSDAQFVRPALFQLLY